MANPPSHELLISLYRQLLKLADKEEQAIRTDNLGELEGCGRRKEEILKKIQDIEAITHIESKQRMETAELIKAVTEKHQRAREAIKTMLDECEEALLTIRNSRQAHRAYYNIRKTGPEHSARLL